MSGLIETVYAATNANTTTSASNAVKKYYDKKFLQRVNQLLPLAQFGQKRPLPEGNGKTIEFTRFQNFAKSVSGATLTEGTFPDATQFKVQALSATIAEYGGWTQLTSLFDQSQINQGNQEIIDAVGEWAAQVMSQVYHNAVCSSGIYPLAADLSATSTYSGVVDSATSTTLVDAAIGSNTNYGDANDDLNQSIVVITSGTGEGQARVVTDFVTSGGTMTVSPAWDVTPAAGDTYVVTTPDELTTGDVLSYTNLSEARTILKLNRAQTFGDGYYVLVASPNTVKGLMVNDTVWKNAHTYQDTTQLYAGEVGKFAGFRIVEETDPFRFPITTRGTSGTSYGPGAAGANYSATGAIYTNLALGMNSFGLTTFSKKSGQISKPPLYINKAAQSGTYQPIPRYDTIGWMLEAVCKPLNPLFAVGIWTV